MKLYFAYKAFLFICFWGNMACPRAIKLTWQCFFCFWFFFLHGIDINFLTPLIELSVIFFCYWIVGQKVSAHIFQQSIIILIVHKVVNDISFSYMISSIEPREIFSLFSAQHHIISIYLVPSHNQANMTIIIIVFWYEIYLDKLWYLTSEN